MLVGPSPDDGPWACASERRPMWSAVHEPAAIRSVDAMGQAVAVRRTVSAHVLVLVLFGAEGWVSRSRQRVSVYRNGVVEAMKAWIAGRSRSGAVSWR